MRFPQLTAFLLFSTIGFSQQTPITKANYEQAARFSPNRLKKTVFSTSVEPHWLKKSDRFWYEYETSDGKRWYIVDPAKKEKKQLFDNIEMAAKITRIVKDPFEAQHLPIQNIKFIKDENWIQFEVKSSVEEDSTRKEIKRAGAKAIAGTQKKTFFFEYNYTTKELIELDDYKKPKVKTAWANIAPDSSIVVFGREYNLYWMDWANYEKLRAKEEDSTIIEHPLTKDGIENFSYYNARTETEAENNVSKEQDKRKRKPVNIYWSPDSKYFTLTRVDNQKVKDLWVINSLSQPRPTLETYKYMMAGEKDAPVEHLYLFDLSAKKGQEITVSRFKDQNLTIWSAPRLANRMDDEHKPSLWLGTNERFYFGRISRDMKKLDICMADIKDDTVRTLIEESANTPIEINRGGPQLGLVNGGKELILWSEQDGWAHYYLYDEFGKLKNQITSGPWHTSNILRIDEKQRVLYFEANGHEQNEDPYYTHAYKVDLDGAGLQLLNQGNFEHDTKFNDRNSLFVDNYSRVNTTPRSVLYDGAGKKLMELETADLSLLMGAGYQFPETFKVKADDGITDLYGVIYKPVDFDSTRKYPLIEYVYPGPQTEAVDKAFSIKMDRTQRLANLGFIVITVGNRGGHSLLSKWYHDYGYGNLRDYGLADKKTAAEQLANRYRWIDINRIGIHGHSGGGFMSTAAMLVYPDFFKVAVSCAGNHDNSIYNRWWSERHHGVKEVIAGKDTSFVYSIDKNPALAKNLKGHLLLVTGDIDNNVHPANTIRVADALIKANKRFDFLMLPGQRHAFGDMSEYFFWRMADYFTQYLMGDTSEHPVDMIEMNRDIPQNGPKN